MMVVNDGKHMAEVWRLPAICRWEKSYGKHPTQKPLALLTRIILASTDEHDWILDPFAGSSTTGIAANLCGRRFLGIEQESNFAILGKNRREELNNQEIRLIYRDKLSDLSYSNQEPFVQEPTDYYGIDLPF